MAFEGKFAQFQCMMPMFQELPDSARVWVYQANRFLTDAEATEVLKMAGDFLSGWTSHEKPMHGACALEENRLLVIVLNEEEHAASGCGIDKSVGFVRKLGERFSIDWFNRLEVLYQGPDGSFSTHRWGTLRKALEEGTLHPNGKVFRNQVQTLGELRTSWKVSPAELA
jgi:hypothetical protein